MSWNLTYFMLGLIGFERSTGWSALLLVRARVVVSDSHHSQPHVSCMDILRGLVGLKEVPHNICCLRDNASDRRQSENTLWLWQDCATKRPLDCWPSVSGKTRKVGTIKWAKACGARLRTEFKQWFGLGVCITYDGPRLRWRPACRFVLDQKSQGLTTRITLQSATFMLQNDEPFLRCQSTVSPMRDKVTMTQLP